MSRPPRLRGFSYVGPAQYSLTLCTYARSPLFHQADVVAGALTQVRSVARREMFLLLAYCFMPDHAHLLVEAQAEHSDLRRFVKLAKQHSGAAYARGSRGRLWQEGYYDRILRGDADLKTVARYIVANPVRAGLVNSPADYPYAGSDRWTMEELLEGISI